MNYSKIRNTIGASILSLLTGCGVGIPGCIDSTTLNIPSQEMPSSANTDNALKAVKKHFDKKEEKYECTAGWLKVDGNLAGWYKITKEMNRSRIEVHDLGNKFYVYSSRYTDEIN